MKKDENDIWMVVTENELGIEVCEDWFAGGDAREKAEECAKQCKEIWPDREFWADEGTHLITLVCRGCGSVYVNEIYDAYGISTGHWCDDCYNSDRYPYRKDRYDYEGAGERLDEDY